MTILEAKKISIVSYLEDNGYTGKQKGARYWFCSPLRNEKTASFSVDPVANIWTDWGTGQHGDIIDLVQILTKSTVSEALQKLSGSKFEIIPNTAPASNKQKPASEIILRQVRPVQANALIKYLDSRKIPSSLSTMYLQEAHYTVKKKDFFSVAFANDLGGYELRNKYYKNCIAPKYITSFLVPGSKQLNLFEGFFNYLAALTYLKIDAFQIDTIILNSVTNLHHINNLLPQYEKINSYLDNDASGRNCLENVTLLNKNTVNKSMTIHPRQKDFNDFIIYAN